MYNPEQEMDVSPPQELAKKWNASKNRKPKMKIDSDIVGKKILFP